MPFAYIFNLSRICEAVCSQENGLYSLAIRTDSSVSILSFAESSSIWATHSLTLRGLAKRVYFGATSTILDEFEEMHGFL